MSDGEVHLHAPSCWRTTDLLGGSVKRYNAPFTVCQAQWNPCIDLVALASEKGEINTRRRLWKRGWKVNLGGVKPLPQQQNVNDENAKLCSICWSPGGMFLAVGFSNGIIHMLEREHGHIVYSVSSSTFRLKCAIIKMCWGSLNEGLRIEEDDRIAGLVAEVSSRSKKMEKTSTIESIELLKTFCDQAYNSEILGAVLLVVDDQNAVHVIAAGILPITCISPPVHLFGNCDPYSITVNDVCLYDNAKLLVSYSYVGETTNGNKKTFGYTTQVVTFDIDSFGCFKNGSVWRITYRWLRLYYSICSVFEVFSRMTADWEQQSKHFHKAFEKLQVNDTEGNSITVAECFIGHILCGNSEIELQRYFRELSEADWKKMNDWVGRGFSKLIKLLKNELWTSVELYQHHLKKLVNDIRFATQHFDSANILPKRIFDVDVYPYGGYDEDEPDSDLFLDALKNVVSSADRLHFKVAELIEISIRNRERLLNFMRWLSSTMALRNKGGLMDANVSSKYNLKQLIEFILEVFVLSNSGKVTGLVEQVRRLYKCNCRQLDASKISSNKFAYSPYNGHGICFDKVVGPMCGDIGDNIDESIPKEENDDNSVLGNLKSSDNRSLAYYVKYAVSSLSLIREQVLKIYSSVSKPVKNVYLHCEHLDGFSQINFFMFHIPDPMHLDGRSRDRMITQFGTDPFPALSCISTDGRCHYVYAFSGELIFKNSFANEKLLSSEENKWQRIAVEASEINSTTVPPFATQPLSIDTNVNDYLRPLADDCQTLRDRRIVKFESIGDGSYFGLLRVKRDQGEHVHLFRGFFGAETISIHRDQSSAESFENVVVSGARRLGIAILEPQYTFSGSCLRWFELNDTSACIVATKRIILGEVETTAPMDTPIEVSKIESELREENDSFALEPPTSTYRLRRRSRKRKTLLR